ncbi:unnamed protein product [Brassica oleracea]
MDDTTSMAFFEEFSSLNPVFHTFLFYGRLPSPFSRRKANCLLAGSCMSGNVHVRFREKGGGQKWPWRNSLLSSSMGSALFFFLGEYANMILMRCGTLHLTFVGLPSSGACVPAFLCNKPLWPKISGRWSCVAFGEG